MSDKHQVEGRGFEPSSLGSGLLSLTFSSPSPSLSLWIAIVCLQISTATRAQNSLSGL